MPSISSSVLLFATRYSWRAQNALVFDVPLDLPTQHAAQLPIIQGFGLHHFNYAERDPWAAPLFGHLLTQQNGGFIDVGANIGSMAINLMASVWPETYTAFDPNTACCAYIERLLHVNKRQGSVYPVALGDSFGKIDLKLNDDMDVSATMVEGFRPDAIYSRHRSALVVRGDDIVRERKSPVRILKIDAEGAEPDVLRGFAETIAADRPVIVLEVSPYLPFLDDTYNRAYFGEIGLAERERIAAFRRRLISELDQFCAERGYLPFRMRSGQYQQAESFDPGATHDDHDLNWLAVPQERRGEIQTLRI